MAGGKKELPCRPGNENFFTMEIGNIGDSQKPPLSVLLIDDQPIIGEAVRRMLSDQPDLEFHYCQSPTSALSEAAKVKPAVILQDLVMPDVDGLTLVKFFRANPATRDVPLVVLSSEENPDIKYKAFELGANDYMVKFPDRLEVLARIRYHSRAYMTLVERNEAMRRLQESQLALKKELDEASNYVQSLLPPKFDDGQISFDWIFKSSTELGGDCFGYWRIDEDNIAIYLLDVCGHGVGAALLSVSAANALRSQSLRGVDFRKPSCVLEALNSAFDMEKQNGMYFTIWYGVYNARSKRLAYSSGGHPPAAIVSGGGRVEKLSTGGMIVGGMPGTKFKEAEAEISPGSRLYVFSDGVYEVNYADGRGMMGVDEFIAELAKPAKEKSKVEEMMRFSQSAQNSERFEDDFSLFEISFKQ